jgi:hypothetical protein
MWLLYVHVILYIVFSFSNSAIFLVDIFNCLKVGSFEASFTVLFKGEMCSALVCCFSAEV